MIKMRQMLNIEKLKEDFPVLNLKINGKRLVYLDSGATSLTPKQVVDAMSWYYNNCRGSVHRGVHSLSRKASVLYENAREVVAKFINAEKEEIIFTSGTTESLNLAARLLGRRFSKGDEIVLTEMEHHSNLVPWQQLAKEKNLVLKYIKVKKDGSLDLRQAREVIGQKTRVVSVVHVSNVLGNVNDVKQIGEMAHAVNALVVVDGAQSVPSMKIDVKELDVDFFAFSGHKMTGPTGVGVLY